MIQILTVSRERPEEELPYIVKGTTSFASKEKGPENEIGVGEGVLR